MRKVSPSLAPLRYAFTSNQQGLWTKQNVNVQMCLIINVCQQKRTHLSSFDCDYFLSQVGGIKPGCFKIGNTGGMLDNILASKLYRPGSVAYVSRSGGMSNELNNIISRTTDGVYEGVAIGGDRYVICVRVKDSCLIDVKLLVIRFLDGFYLLHRNKFLSERLVLGFCFCYFCPDIQAPPLWTMSFVTRTLQGSRW